MQLCDYGCGQEAKYQFKNGKWCCSKYHASCSTQRKKNSLEVKKSWKDPNSGLNLDIRNEKISNNMKEVWVNPIYKKELKCIIKELHKDPNSKYNSISCNEKRSKKMKKLHKDPNSVYHSKTYKENQSKGLKKVWEDLLYKENQSNRMKDLWKNPIFKDKYINTIKKFNKKYPIFSKIEEMRYNPDTQIEEREIQVHCKNHECKNSKEKGGWFVPTKSQLSERIQAIENPRGFGESNFYCSQKCKDTCILYGLQSDPLKDNNLPYTPAEYKVCRAVVFDREKGLCEYCGEPATDMHHIFSIKLEPFFALDPDYCIACCEKHHYKYAHRDECSTGNLAKIVCSVESQKFLNQK